MDFKSIDVPILLDNFNGDEEILLDMISAFEHALHNLINPIRESIVKEDADLLRINAHTFKGIMKSFYVEAGSELAHQLELIGIHANFHEALSILNKLENHLMIFLYELQFLKQQIK